MNLERKPIIATSDDLLSVLTRRYRGLSVDALIAVLCPLLVPIESLDRTVRRLAGQGHWRASFRVVLDSENESVVQRGRTGKFIPAGFADGTAPWQEIAKGRIISVDPEQGLASGEIYVGGQKNKLEEAVSNLHVGDLLEIDQFGASAKILSGLAEYSLVAQVQASGYNVRRMPEDMAQHLGHYANYDFEFEKEGVTKKIEVKSLWGTNTDYARLIHSTTSKPKGPEASWRPEQRANHYPTSSCKFATQDIFAVSLFLRTGNISDFAFARSVPRDVRPYGLPRASKHPEHVNQNPQCTVGDGTWYSSLDEVWELE